MADPTQTNRRSLRFLRIALWFVLLLLVVFQTFLEARSQKRQVRKRLKSCVELCAQRLEKKNSDFGFALIALVEQRSIREGFARLNEEGISATWALGFLEALDGATRSIMVSHPGVENLAFRSLEGIKLAGSGADRDSITYPDLRLRMQRQTIRRESDPFTERIVVPVRAADASPVAFLTADLNLKGFYREVLTEFDSESDALVLLADASGRRIWSNDDELVLTDFRQELREFEHNRKVFLAESALIPEANHRIYAAIPQNVEIAVSFEYFAWNIAAIAVIILLFWSCESAMFRRRHAPKKRSA